MTRLDRVLLAPRCLVILAILTFIALSLANLVCFLAGWPLLGP
jgi:hypothetical protein